MVKDENYHTNLGFSCFLPSLVTQVKKGVGSFFTIGTEAVKKKSALKLYLWVYLCDWQLFQRDEILLTSNEERRATFESVVSKLIGKMLLKIEVENEGLRLEFSDGFFILIQPDLNQYDEDDDLIIMYLNDDATVSFSTQKGFYYELVEPTTSV